MSSSIASVVKSLFKFLNLNISKYSTLTTTNEVVSRLCVENEVLRDTVQRAHLNLELFVDLNDRRLIPFYMKSQSQIGQDLFVLSELNLKRNGFFVEFGATNGVSLSNSFLLESEFGWTGILAEPARCWREALAKNRKAQIDYRCVWSRSGESLTFRETASRELSTLESFASSDYHRAARQDGQNYPVETITLNDLLAHHRAPDEIDYLSIDTEGSEYEILKEFDFTKYRIRIITVEHNNAPEREKIHALLSGHGYERKYESHSDFDDWYVLPPR